MKIYYNSKNNAFYDSSIHPSIPKGSIEITKEKHDELLKQQSNGLMIQPDKKGNPVAVERVITKEEVTTMNFFKRESLLSEAEGEILILSRAIKHGVASSEDEERLDKLEVYTIVLSRLDLSQEEIDWPPKP